jgi:rare lipoprotein A
MTVAHRTLPFGTVIEIRNPRNNQSVHAVVTDRGPMARERVLDVSFGIARILRIDRQGVALVEYFIVHSRREWLYL